MYAVTPKSNLSFSFGGEGEDACASKRDVAEIAAHAPSSSPILLPACETLQRPL